MTTWVTCIFIFTFPLAFRNCWCTGRMAFLSPKPKNTDRLKKVLQLIWEQLLHDSVNKATLSFTKKDFKLGWKLGWIFWTCCETNCWRWKLNATDNCQFLQCSAILSRNCISSKETLLAIQWTCMTMSDWFIFVAEKWHLKKCTTNTYKLGELFVISRNIQ